MALDGNVAGTAVWSAINALTTEQKQNTEAVWQLICNTIFTHMINNMEIKDITTVLNTSLFDVFSQGTPAANDGGAALQTAWKDATNNGAADGATQDNDGTGLVQ